jgi:hypothetical protein
MNNKCSHQQYYAQFVNDNVKLMVKDRIGLDIIQKSRDEHFNDIPLRLWDNCGLPYGIKDLLKQAKDWHSLSAQCCILKEAARQIKEK